MILYNIKVIKAVKSTYMRVRVVDENSIYYCKPLLFQVKIVVVVHKSDQCLQIPSPPLVYPTSPAELQPIKSARESTAVHQDTVVRVASLQKSNSVDL